MNAHNSQEKRRFSCRGDFTMSRTLRSQDKDAAGTLRNTVILKSYQVAWNRNLHSERRGAHVKSTRLQVSWKRKQKRSRGEEGSVLEGGHFGFWMWESTVCFAISENNLSERNLAWRRKENIKKSSGFCGVFLGGRWIWTVSSCPHTSAGSKNRPRSDIRSPVCVCIRMTGQVLWWALRSPQ